jgi:hypothetical protein
MWAATPFIKARPGLDHPDFSEENFSNLNKGQQMHEDFTDPFLQQTGTKVESWQVNTAKGQTGPDFVWQDPAKPPPGMDFVELKPATRNGWEQFNGTETEPGQLDAWHNMNEGPVQEGQTLQLWVYDRQGNYMNSGYNFTARGQAWVGSNAPGFGPSPVFPGIPDAGWGAAAAGFSSTVNSTHGNCGNK